MGSEDKLAPHNPVPLRHHSVDEMGPFTKTTYVLNPGYLVSVPESEEGLGQLGLCSASSPLRYRPDLGSPEPFTVVAVFSMPIPDLHIRPSLLIWVAAGSPSMLECSTRVPRCKDKYLGPGRVRGGSSGGFLVTCAGTSPPLAPQSRWKGARRRREGSGWCAQSSRPPVAGEGQGPEWPAEGACGSLCGTLGRCTGV